MSTIQSISPVDGSVYAERPVADAEQVTALFARSKLAQHAWAQLSVAERCTYCTAAVDAMVAMTDRIAEELVWQMGRPISQGAGEVRGLEERARYMISVAEESLCPVDPGEKPGFARKISKEPLGVIMTIAPWNFPFMTALNSVIPALLAGNAVVLKHAANTLLVAERIQDAFDQAGLPEGVFQHIVLDHDATSELIGSGNVDMVCFTGSVGGGKAMEKAAAGQFIPLGLELGGKDPAYVRADANLPYTIENLADGAFFNSGQSCCSIERIYVHESIHDELVAGLAAAGQAYVLGNPLDAATNLGPMIKPAAADFVRQQIADAVAAGAQAHVDTSQFELDQPGSAYMAPQVLSNVTHEMSVMTDESFGPVVGVIKVASDEEAIALMNDSEFGLTAGIWTEDLAAAERIAPQLETGTVFMNRCDYLDPALAWTGVKDTGRGCSLSTLGFDALTRPKSFHFKTSTD
ncbi:aldehyde dehydrogenase family protein [Aliamphritea spongicola]|uniref:aldehyde dehydrogenase family protein n=1 Tax=Aliamphritea spongicola TaxID=707589 RepID=UPI00196B3029|nr:aldehyde dehydrogenase family protein [Aliamphritea spongicola]MBN3563223.1 aldehyde dehydrogenase family protein [Aliamphritea spongicola]